MYTLFVDVMHFKQLILFVLFKIYETSAKTECTIFGSAVDYNPLKFNGMMHLIQISQNFTLEMAVLIKYESV